MTPQIEENAAISTDQRRSIVHAQPCFSNLSPEENTQLAELLREVYFAPGDLIVREADPIDCVYFIVTGEADVRHVTFQNGEPNVESVATLKPGGTIGLNDTGFYSLTGRRTATVVANTDMLLLRLSLAVFHGFSLVNRHVSKVMREHAASMLRAR